jgi:hypothetical protein
MQARNYRKVTKVIETVRSGTLVALLGEPQEEKIDCNVENLWISRV